MADPVAKISALPTEADKADRVKLWSFARPHYLSFHLSWLAFFVAFNAWFSVAPLMPVIKKSLAMTKDQVQMANLASVSTTVVARVLIGPLCDRFGPKTTMALLLAVGAIPVFCVGLVDSWQGLVALRAAIGVLGASFVMSQAWVTNMFQRKVIGSANAIVGGWGNLGGGSIQALMVLIFDSMQRWGATSERAWRLSFIFPGAALLIVAALVYTLGKDTPRGDISELVRQGEQRVNAKASLRSALSNYMTYVMAIQYAASFGVELVVFNMAASYFHDEFKADVVQAGKIAMLCGITNIFARWLGGFISDCANRYAGMKGRIATQFTLVVFEAILLVWFSHAQSQSQATALLLAFSIFVQAANGSCFAIVPYISKQYGGSVYGLVGAGGNCGAIAFTLLFLNNKFKTTADGFRIMGWIVLGCSFFVWLIRPDLLTKDPLDMTVDRTLQRSGSANSMDASSEEGDIEMAKGKVVQLQAVEHKVEV